MTDKETIRAEIERRMDKHWNLLPDADSPEDDWTHNELCELGAFKELEHLETFLDILPEQPEVDLKKEVTKFVLSKEYIEGKEPPVLLTARHFYELGCRHTAVMYDDIEYERQMAEEAEISKGLEEEIKNYFQGYWPGTNTAEQCNTDLHFTPPAIMRLARHFAEWQREQDQQLIELAEDHAMLAGMNKMKEEMMEKAVEGVAEELYNDGDVHCTVGVGTHFKPGDKVRVIVIPE